MSWQGLLGKRNGCEDQTDDASGSGANRASSHVRRLTVRIIKSVAFGVSRLLRVHEMQESLTNRMLIKSAMEEGELRLHLGCGAQVLGGWVNVDMRSRPGVVVMKLPEGLERLDNNSVRYIYASHLLEHLEYPGEALATVRECYRILSPGGVLRCGARNTAGYSGVCPGRSGLLQDSGTAPSLVVHNQARTPDVRASARR